MRFKKTLDNNYEKMAKTLTSDCSKFLKEIKGGKNNFVKNGWILRGSKSLNHTLDNGLMKMNSHVDSGRKPRAAKWFVHNLVNIVSEDLFGWKIRDGVPTMGGANRELGTTSYFGKLRIFLPIGDYKYVWSPNIQDFNDINKYTLFDDIYNKRRRDRMEEALDIIISLYDTQGNEAEEIFRENDIDLTYKEVYNEAKKCMTDFIKTQYKDKQLHGAIEMGNEISFNCDKYYLVEDDTTFFEAIKLIGGYKK